MLELSRRRWKTGQTMQTMVFFPSVILLHCFSIPGAPQKSSCRSGSCSSARCCRQCVTASLWAGMGFRMVGSESSLLQYCQSHTLKQIFMCILKTTGEIQKSWNFHLYYEPESVRQTSLYKNDIFPIFPKWQGRVEL